MVIGATNTAADDVLFQLQISESWRTQNPVDQFSTFASRQDDFATFLDTNYEGGYTKFAEDNPEDIEVFDNFQQELYDRAQESTKQTNTEFVKEWATDFFTMGDPGQDNGEATVFEGAILRLAQTGLKGVAGWADALGYEEFAQERLKDIELIENGWQDSGNRAAELVASVEGAPAEVVSNAAYGFLSSVIPGLKPNDEVAKGVAEELGLDRALSVFNLGAIAGDFAKTKAILNVLPGPNTGPTYFFKYGIAAAINHTVLGRRPQEFSGGDFLATGAMTMGALWAGDKLSKAVMSRPMMHKFYAQAPEALAKYLGPKAGKFAADFTRDMIAGRVADIGESLANSAAVGYNTGNWAATFAAFPAALAHNMVEELVVDMVGLPSSKLNRGAQRLHEIKGMSNAVDRRIQNVEKPPIITRLLSGKYDAETEKAKLLEIKSLLDKSYDKREKSFLAWSAKHGKEVDAISVLSPKKVFDFISDARSQGWTDVETNEALQAKVFQFNALEDGDTSGFDWGVRKEVEDTAIEHDKIVMQQVTAFHGGPHEFEKFSSEAIGTGEGAQAFGHGLYFTDQEDIAKYYADTLGKQRKPTQARIDKAKEELKNAEEIVEFAKTHPKSSLAAKNSRLLKRETDKIEALKQNIATWEKQKTQKRNLFKVTLHKGKEPSEYTWMDWDKKLSEVNKINLIARLRILKVEDTGLYSALLRTHGRVTKEEKSVISVRRHEIIERINRDYTGGETYKGISNLFYSDKKASDFLLGTGIDGIRYPAGTLSGGGAGTNYVVFDEAAVTIEEHTQFSTTPTMEGDSLKTFSDLIMKQTPEVQGIVRGVDQRGWIEVDVQAFEEATNKKWKGEPAIGRTAFINGNAFISFLYGAGDFTGAHEFYHFIEALTMSDARIEVVADIYGGSEARADAFAAWYINPTHDSVPGRAWNSMYNFMQRILNVFKGRGFQSATDVFSQAVRGDLQKIRDGEALRTYYNTYVKKGFLDGGEVKPVIANHREEYPEAHTKNAVRFWNDRGSLNMSMMTLSPENIKAIEEYIDSSNIQPISEIIISDATNDWIVTRADYDNNNGDLQRTLQKTIDHLTHDKPRSAIDLYSTEPETTGEFAEREAGGEQVRTQGYWKTVTEKVGMLKKNFLPFIGKTNAQRVEHWISQPLYLKDTNSTFNDIYQANETWWINKAKAMEQYLTAKETGKLKAYLHGDKSKSAAAQLSSLMTQSKLSGTVYSQEDLDEMLGDIPPKDKEWIKASYAEIRGEFDKVAIDMIGRISKRIQETSSNLQAAREEEWEQSIIKDMETEISLLEEQRRNLKMAQKSFYLPSNWFATNGDQLLRFSVGEGQYTDEVRDIIKEISAYKGQGETWIRKLDVDREGELMFVLPDNMLKRINPFSKNKRAIVGEWQAKLRKAGITATHIEVTEKTEDVVNPDFRRIDQIQLVSKLMDSLDADDTRTIEIIKRKLDLIWSEDSWARHKLHNTGVMGFDIKNWQTSIIDYMSGYVGYNEKMKAAEKMYKSYDKLDKEANSELMIGVKRYMKGLLANTRRYERLANSLTSFLFHKHVAFDPKFTFRNLFQNITKGIPNVQRLLPWDGTNKDLLANAGISWKQMIKAKWDVRFRLYKYFATSTFEMSDADYITSLVNTQTPDEAAFLTDAIANKGLFSGDVASVMTGLRSQFNSGNITYDKFRQALTTLSGWGGRYVRMSDASNRVETALAAYRSFREKTDSQIEAGESFDAKASQMALDASRKSNVDYSSGNDPAIINKASVIRGAKPFFQFQKFSWNFIEQFARDAGDGKRGWFLQAQMMTLPALLVGAGGLPFWEKLVELLGLEKNASDLRKMVIDASGGSEIFAKFIDTGIFGMIPGVDMSLSMGVDPASVLDPLFGDNSIFGLIDEIGYTFNDLKTGQIAKAILEGAATPGYISDVWRAIRVNDQGVTTFRGDVILDMYGRPMKLNMYETAMYAMGFMPERLGNTFKAAKKTKIIQRYWKDRKANIGTQYKLAVAEGDNADIKKAQRDARDYNIKLNKYRAKDGTLPVPRISSTTFKNWNRPSGTKRARHYAKYYYFSY